MTNPLRLRLHFHFFPSISLCNQFFCPFSLLSLVLQFAITIYSFCLSRSNFTKLGNVTHSFEYSKQNYYGDWDFTKFEFAKIQFKCWLGKLVHKNFNRSNLHRFTMKHIAFNCPHVQAVRLQTTSNSIPSHSFNATLIVIRNWNLAKKKICIAQNMTHKWIVCFCLSTCKYVCIHAQHIHMHRYGRILKRINFYGIQCVVGTHNNNTILRYFSKA